jgi:DNA-binding FrmR family transcriptional regulator
MIPNAKTEALKRLNYIEGHLSGIRRMLEEDQYCIDILKQTYAVRRAIEKMESIILEGHLQTLPSKVSRAAGNRKLLRN